MREKKQVPTNAPVSVCAEYTTGVTATPENRDHYFHYFYLEKSKISFYRVATGQGYLLEVLEKIDFLEFILIQ